MLVPVGRLTIVRRSQGRARVCDELHRVGGGFVTRLAAGGMPLLQAALPAVPQPWTASAVPIAGRTASAIRINL